MKIFYKPFWFFFGSLILSFAVSAQEQWPKSISGDHKELIKIYQPQVEGYGSNILKARSAVSVIQDGKTDPVFGACWWEAATSDNGNTVNLLSMHIINIKFPDAVDESMAAGIRSRLETAISGMHISLAKDELQHSLESTENEARLASSFNNAPPKIIYTANPSMLVLIDGEPKLQRNDSYGVDVVVNSPYTIVKNDDGRFYLYGGKGWYSAASPTGPYRVSSTVPENLSRIEAAVKKNAANTPGNGENAQGDARNDENTHSSAVPEIIVSTQPAELIQSDGEANFAPVENTGLLYVKNSSNDIFMDVNSQQYYVLLSGRWYKSPSLSGNWQYIGADHLPGDFAKIPAGSPKDNVLASVAGTPQAEDALTDAAVPQTARVERKTATANITFDGDPQFENINGTRLQYAVNASNTVMRLDSRYYAVDNGVWFTANSAFGPWEVSTTRPADVDNIPPAYPVYNSKYVYVYDATPDYVYTGYTPGYLNAYAYGPTIVYGTGYYYRPWYRHYYYARPLTWGFGVNYTPWYGWGLGYSYGYDWFNIGFGFNSWWGGGYRYGGWWGPAVYRPCYAFGGGYYHNYGYYGYNAGFAYRNNARYNINYTNNIYYNRRNVYAYNNRTFVNNRYNNNNGRSYTGDNGGRAYNGGRTYNGGGYNNNGNYNNGRSAAPRENGPVNGGIRGGNNGSNNFGNNRYNTGNINPGDRFPQNQSSAAPREYQGSMPQRSYGGNRGQQGQNNAAPRQYEGSMPQRSLEGSRAGQSQPSGGGREYRGSMPQRSYGGGGGSIGGGRSSGGGGGNGGGNGGGRHNR